MVVVSYDRNAEWDISKTDERKKKEEKKKLTPNWLTNAK